jgi:hypothetical protein
MLSLKTVFGGMRQFGEAQMTARTDSPLARTTVLCGIVALLVTLALAFCPRSAAYASPTATRAAPPIGQCLLHYDTRSADAGSVRPAIAANRPVPHNAPRNRLAAAGFPAIAAAMAGAFLAGCGLLFVTVGRRRRI